MAVPGVIVLGLFLDGALVELVDDPLDVLGYLRGSADFRRASRTRGKRRHPGGADELEAGDVDELQAGDVTRVEPTSSRSATLPGWSRRCRRARGRRRHPGEAGDVVQVEPVLPASSRPAPSPRWSPAGVAALGADVAQGNELEADVASVTQVKERAADVAAVTQIKELAASGAVPVEPADTAELAIDGAIIQVKERAADIAAVIQVKGRAADGGGARRGRARRGRARRAHARRRGRAARGSGVRRRGRARHLTERSAMLPYTQTSRRTPGSAPLGAALKATFFTLCSLSTTAL